MIEFAENDMGVNQYIPIKTAAGLALLLWFLTASPEVAADWISLTGAEKASTVAEIYIDDDRIRVYLEIGDVDLKAFKLLFPDHAAEVIKKDAVAESIKRFSKETFQIIAGRGPPLQAKLIRAERRPRKPRGVKGPYEEDGAEKKPQAMVMYAELAYPLDGKPELLELVPPRGAGGKPAAEIGFVVFHKTVPVIDYQYLSGAERLRLDWDDPWYTRFENPKLTRHHKAPLMSFLYIEPYEVRQEILVRVKDLAPFLDLDMADARVMGPGQSETVKTAIVDYLRARNPVAVDGKVLKPVLDRADYVQINLAGIQPLENPQRLDGATAMVGVVFAYITPGLPQRVTVDWEIFTKEIQQVPITAFDPLSEFVSYVTPAAPVFEWPNFPEDLERLKDYAKPDVEAMTVASSKTQLELPIGSVVCVLLLPPLGWWIAVRRRNMRPVLPQLGLAAVLIAGAVFLYPYLRVPVMRPAAISPTLTLKEKQAILTGLLKNVYRAFDFREEEDIYDKLALSVSGDLLEDIYLQNRQALEVRKAGGARAKVNEVRLALIADAPGPERPLAFTVKSRWTALGTVGHWGHVHARKNEYEALITIEPVEGLWKITGLDLLKEKRIEPQPIQSAAEDDATG